MVTDHREAYEQLPQVKMQRAIRSYQRHIVPRQAALIEAWAHGEPPADEETEVAFIRQARASFSGTPGGAMLAGCRWPLG